MLGDKYRVTAHGRLFPSFAGCAGARRFDKIRGVLVNGFSTFVPAVLPFLIA
jgi:hypothetical protein